MMRALKFYESRKFIYSYNNSFGRIHESPVEIQEHKNATGTVVTEGAAGDARGSGPAAGDGRRVPEEIMIPTRRRRRR